MIEGGTFSKIWGIGGPNLEHADKSNYSRVDYQGFTVKLINGVVS